jgi:hypothetical protein
MSTEKLQFIECNSGEGAIQCKGLLDAELL